MQVSRFRWRSLVLCWCACLFMACSGQPGQPWGTMLPVESGQTLVYKCGDYEFVARTGPGEIALYLPNDYRVLVVFHFDTA